MVLLMSNNTNTQIIFYYIFDKYKFVRCLFRDSLKLDFFNYAKCCFRPINSSSESITQYLFESYECTYNPRNSRSQNVK